VIAAICAEPSVSFAQAGPHQHFAPKANLPSLFDRLTRKGVETAAEEAGTAEASNGREKSEKKRNSLSFTTRRPLKDYGSGAASQADTLDRSRSPLSRKRGLRNSHSRKRHGRAQQRLQSQSPGFQRYTSFHVLSTCRCAQHHQQHHHAQGLVAGPSGSRAQSFAAGLSSGREN